MTTKEETKERQNQEQNEALMKQKRHFLQALKRQWTKKLENF